MSGAGDMRDWVSIYEKSATPIAGAGRQVTYTLRCSCFAEVKVLRVKDEVYAMKEAEMRTHEVTLYKAYGAAYHDRVTWGTDNLTVTGVRPHKTDRAKVVLECVTEKV